MLRDDVAKILQDVEKPGRYIGGEWNSTKKCFKDTSVRMAFCFPDVYEVAMSHLGMQILYGLVNETTPYLMERCFCPWPDMMGLMEEKGIPLYSLESFTPLNEFSVVGFTLQYEMSYTNILKMLSMGNIPLLREERWKRQGMPLIVAGGPCAVNPEPLHEFFDLFMIGDGEETLASLLELVEVHGDENGYIDDKKAFLIEASKIEGIYVPFFFEAVYEEGVYQGTFLKEEFKGLVSGKVRRAIVKDLDNAYFPVKPVMPFVDAVHDRMMLEVLRGCSHTCRFCQAGMIYRPVREKKLETLLAQSEKLYENTGYDDISLTSLSTADYTQVKPLVENLIEDFSQYRTSVSLPSLRVDTFSVSLAEMIQKVRKTGFTFAPEAGTQRMRDVINKGVTKEGLIDSLTGAFEAGWQRVKLYFMIGLPEERDEDVKGIMELGKEMLTLGRKVSGSGRIMVTVSVSSFVPKPFTPFQWFGQNSKEELKRKQMLLKEELSGKGIKLSYHNTSQSILEGMLARGDRRLSKLLLKLFEEGCIYDSWDEWYDKEKWQRAFEAAGIRKEDYSERFFEEEDPLYWDHIDIGVSKDYLYREYEKSRSGALTKDCRLGCAGCGLCEGEMQIQLKGAYNG